MGSGEGFTVRVTIAALEAEDPALRRLAGERYGLVQQAIAARLPHSPNQIQTAMHLHAIIAGATMQWVASDGSSGLSEFVLDRLKWAVDHIHPLA
jgi:hypothetical protein